MGVDVFKTVGADERGRHGLVAGPAPSLPCRGRNAFGCFNHVFEPAFINFSYRWPDTAGSFKANVGSIHPVVSTSKRISAALFLIS